MKDSKSCPVANAAAGALAGLVGTLTLVAMRSFDQRYAPRTIAKVKEDPGMWAVKKAESAASLEGKVPESAEKAAALATSLGYGAVAGAVYGVLRGGKGTTSALCDGAILGTAVYAASYAGVLPLAGLTKPVWKQPFPAIIGGHLRHTAYGVVTALAFKALNCCRSCAK